MWSTFPYQVTIHTPAEGVADEYGNATDGAFTSTVVPGDVQPAGTAEGEDGLAETDSVDRTFFLAAGSVVTSSSQLSVDGAGFTADDRFEVIAPPDVRDTGSTLDYVRVRARLTS